MISLNEPHYKLYLKEVSTPSEVLRIMKRKGLSKYCYTFYVKDMFGLKYHAASKQRSLEKKLREAISQGAERAKNA